MSRKQRIEPTVGDWYRSRGQLFEVVAVDEQESVIEIQHADGDLEEIEMDEWSMLCHAGDLSVADPPEDAGLASDREDNEEPGFVHSGRDELTGLHAKALDDLDLFE